MREKQKSAESGYDLPNSALYFCCPWAIILYVDYSTKGDVCQWLCCCSNFDLSGYWNYVKLLPPSVEGGGFCEAKYRGRGPK